MNDYPSTFSEEEFKDLFDNAHDLVHFLEPDGRVAYVNPSWSRILGYEIGEIKGRIINDFVHPEDLQMFTSYRCRLLQRQQPGEKLLVRFVSKAGNIVYLEGFVSPKFLNGRALYTRGIFRDVSSRVEDEKQLQFYLGELREREENLKQLIEHAPDAVIVADEHSRITLWNPKAEEIFGWSSEQAVGKTLNETIIPEGYRKAHDTGMKRYLSTGEAHILNQTIEISALHRSGREFPISLTISKSQVRGKTVFISFSRDLTAQKKAELELQKQRKDLEQSNRELEQYAWLTSHDLREPLRKMLTFSDLLQRRYAHEMSEEANTYVQKIHDAGKRMGKLIENLLTYSGIAEEHTLFEPVNLNLVINEVLSNLEVNIKETDAEIYVDPLPTIEAIPFQMKQLLQNLVANAIKYKQPNISPRITISGQPKSVSAIELKVADNGIGFQVLDEKKIFGLFQRLHPDKDVKGSGIGLALCKKIVLNHAGSISVESKPGVGSTFSIVLPYKREI